MTTDAQDFLMSGGATGAQFPAIGHSYTGTILSWSMRKQIDFDSGEVKTFANGDAMEQLVIVFATGARGKFDEGAPVDIPDDDGVRALYVKSHLQKAIRDAIKKAGGKGLEEGALLTVTRGKNHPKSDPKKKAPYGYTATYVLAKDNAANAALMDDDEDPFNTEG
jgi:hypothetical protein